MLNTYYRKFCCMDSCLNPIFIYIRHTHIILYDSLSSSVAWKHWFDIIGPELIMHSIKQQIINLAAKLRTFFHTQSFVHSTFPVWDGLWYFLPILCIGSLKLELGSVTCLGAWLTCFDVVSWWGLSWQWELYIETAWWEEQQPCAAFQGFYCNLAQKFNAFICFHGFFILLAFCT